MGRIPAPTGSGEAIRRQGGECDQRGVAWAVGPALVMLSRPSRQLLRGGVFMGGGHRGPRPGSAVVRSERSFRVAARTPVLETFPALRAWQRKALVEYLRRRSEDFTAVATPGAGKTTFALRIAAELLGDGTVEAVTVVAPTEHLKNQWADAAARVGHPARRRVPQRRRALRGRLPRRGGHLRPGGHGPAGAPAAHHDPTHPGHPRRDPPRRRLPVLGRRGEERLRARRTPADAHRDAVPLRRQPDPVRQLRAGRGRAAALPRRLRVRLLRRAARRRGPAGALPGVLRARPAGVPTRGRSWPPAWASR